MTVVNTDPVFDGIISSLPFELQESPEWAERRNAILESLRKDAKGLPMTTSQNLIMERMATFYALTRKREADPDFKPSANDLRANNQQWLAMTQEFNKQLTVGEDKRRSAMIETILKIVTDSVNMIEDDRIKKDLITRLEKRFRDADL